MIGTPNNRLDSKFELNEMLGKRDGESGRLRA